MGKESNVLFGCIVSGLMILFEGFSSAEDQVGALMGLYFEVEGEYFWVDAGGVVFSDDDLPFSCQGGFHALFYIFECCLLVESVFSGVLDEIEYSETKGFGDFASIDLD